MIKSKLITILKTLNKRELTKFKEFVQSPFFNKNMLIISLFEKISTHYPFSHDKGLQKEMIYKSLFPGEKYNESKLKNLFSDLYNLAERFLVYISKDENSVDFKKELLKALRERGAEKIILTNIKEAEKKLNMFKLKDKNYFYCKWLIDEEKNFFFAERDRVKYTANLQSEFDNYVNYSLLVFLEFYIRLVNEEGYSKINLRHTFENEIITFFNVRGFEEPVLEIYYVTLMLRITRDEKYFMRLKELKNLHYKLINNLDMYMINSNLQSFYLAQEQLGINIYRKDFFELQKESLDGFTSGKTVPFILFLNVIKTAANLQEFNWADSFIENYGRLIANKYREAVVNFANSYICYIQGKHEKALEILSKIHSETAVINLEIKKLTAIIYYESGAADAAFSMVDSFRHFINSGKISSPVLKKMLLEFVTYYHELLKLKNNKNILNAEMLLNKIEKNPQISNRAWLIRKIKEFL